MRDQHWVPPPALLLMLPAVSTPRLRRRIASMLYEAILLFGVAFIAAYLFLALTQSKYPIPSPMKLVFQAYMFVVIGSYFVWCWRHGGQTMPMKTWKMRVADLAGQTPSLGRAWWRYALIWLSLLPAFWLYALGYKAGLALLPLTLAWALIDPDRQFLHDRLARTRITTT